jgi:hypothetical protein
VENSSGMCCFMFLFLERCPCLDARPTADCNDARELLPSSKVQTFTE